MFMSPQEIVNDVRKGDSLISNGRTAREQWEDPASGYTDSLRNENLNEIKTSKVPGYTGMMEDGTPLSIRHGNGATLTDGHHRLAHHEQRGTAYLPVSHWEGRPALATLPPPVPIGPRPELATTTTWKKPGLLKRAVGKK
jgi:hypothetical protein